MGIPRFPTLTNPPGTAGKAVYKVTEIHVLVDGEIKTLDVSKHEPPIMFSIPEESGAVTINPELPLYREGDVWNVK